MKKKTAYAQCAHCKRVFNSITFKPVSKEKAVALILAGRVLRGELTTCPDCLHLAVKKWSRKKSG